MSTVTHQLKCWPESFAAMIHDLKTFDLRKDDRGFQPGDTVQFEEFRPATNEFTGRTTRRAISYILRDFEGLQPGYCILALI